MLTAILMVAGTAAAQQSPRMNQPPQPESASTDLRAGFTNPPQSARPRVWWHWMNGNITKQGIQLDLDWMHRVGLAGFQNFDAALRTPQVVDQRLAYMTPEWQDAFRYAIQLGDQFGMEMAIAGSPGWSESGGPWVPPAEGMKKYVWSETAIQGGRPFAGKLAPPPSVTGPFQNVATPAGAAGQPKPQFYRDSVVVAYRRPAADVPADRLHATVSASGGTPDLSLLSDGDLTRTAKLPIPDEGDAWIQYQYAEPVTIRAITVSFRDPDRLHAAVSKVGLPNRTLEASDDGRSWRAVADLPPHFVRRTVSFPATTARYFRVVFRAGTRPELPHAVQGDPAALRAIVPPKDYEIAELVLHPGARVNHLEEKAAFITAEDLYGFATPQVDAAAAIKKSEVLDLTSKMRPDGTLDWNPPAGDWVVLRFGYSLLGITNHPATPEATGLEVDKLDRRFVKRYMENYLDSYRKTVGPDEMGVRGIQYVINDSWEAGSQNWTDNMVEQFRTRRGYDPIPWMPVLAGRIVDSAAASDRFLWDFRTTIADLIADEHYGQIETTLHEWNMRHYGESHESGRAFVADGMEVKKMNEVPMSAMWTQAPGVNHEQYGYNADDRESASVAHIYGQNIAAAESLTASIAPWAWSPATLKPTADQELLNGINRFVIHESAHQPLVNKKPGLTLGPYGQWFNRNETWANEAGAWVDYLARSSYMLQQGHFAADLIYFYGEDSNLTALFRNKAPDVPAGYGFDYVNADGLIHALAVNNGRITTPGGTAYRLLALDPYSRHMSLPVLKAIYKLVSDGASVAGPKPDDDPSLADDQAEFQRLARELFGDGSGVHTLGKGTVYAGENVAQALAAMKILPDFDTTKAAGGTRLEFVHRKLADGDIYFVDNRSDNAVHVNATFRVAGKMPELWHADTAGVEPASYRIEDARTTVPLELGPWDAVFVVFRGPAQANARTIPPPTRTDLATLRGAWTVKFPPNWGAPPSITLETLASWSDSSDAGVKYFSGTGTYIKTVNAPTAWFQRGAHVWIDLGDVKNLAEVVVNGKSLGIVWHAPYRVDATAALKPGENELAIRVTNAWVNRLIGDQQPDATKKYTFADVTPYSAHSPLLPSGLLGPVRIYSEARQ